jgi:hypothetical protein
MDSGLVLRFAHRPKPGFFRQQPDPGGGHSFRSGDSQTVTEIRLRLNIGAAARMFVVVLAIQPGDLVAWLNRLS